MGRLDGHVALVSGAASGIGRAVLELLAAEGSTAYGGDVAGAQVDDVAGAVGGRAARLDVTSEESWDEVVTSIRNDAGRLDALVNCAGVDASNDDVEHCTDEEWTRVMRVNLDGTFLGTRAAFAAMRGAGGGGSIVNVSSVLAIVADGEALAYTASKGAVRGLTKSVALEGAPYGIRCNSIHPGYIRTPMTERWIAGLAERGQTAEDLERLHPLGRLGAPEDVARLALYLASDESSFVTGAELAVDGGYLAV